MSEAEIDESSTYPENDRSVEGLDRRPDLSELLEGEVMGSGRRVIEEAQAREKLSHPDQRRSGTSGTGERMRFAPGTAGTDPS
jgi:hypothetical protein